jgi:uncharacterized protein (TIGR02246 family)
MTTTTTVDEIQELGRRWVAAEEAGDGASLADLSTDDFTLVGPLGFVLTRDQWLARYRPGELVTWSLTWDELTVRDHGDTAVVIGRHAQEATYRDRPSDGSFRATHIAVRRDGRWLLAGIHMSPIGAPFAPAQESRP